MKRLPPESNGHEHDIAFIDRHRELNLDNLSAHFFRNVETFGWSEDDKRNALEAFELARHVHEGQLRDGIPYVTHPLRTALLAFELGKEFATPNRIIALLFHDGLEDAAHRFLDEEKVEKADVDKRIDQMMRACEEISNRWGEETAWYLAGLTGSPYPARDKSPEQKRKRYKSGLNQEVFNPPSVSDLTRQQTLKLLKCLDYIDNLVGLKFHDDPSKAALLKEKYEFVRQMIIISITEIYEEGGKFKFASGIVLRHLKSIPTSLDLYPENLRMAS